MIIDHLFDPARRPQIGIAISTFGSTPYLHLHLESWRRFGSGTPLLVFDDNSPQHEQLANLCDDYGAHFVSSTKNHKTAGRDLRGFLAAFEWAAKNQIDLLVKFSSVWIPIVEWQTSLIQTVLRSQYALYSAGLDLAPRFQCDAVAFHVDSWLSSGALEPLREYSLTDQPPPLEWLIYQAAQEVSRRRCAANRRYSEANPDRVALPFCGHWPFLPQTESSLDCNVLWKDWARPHEYLRALRQWGIDYYQRDELDSPPSGPHQAVLN